MTTLCPLTPSQLRLVQHLAAGNTYAQIAKLVYRSHDGVKCALKETRDKVGARNSVHLVAMALSNGWIE